jgi:glutaredoxin 2
MMKNNQLTLYVRDYCMYCNRVIRKIGQLGLDIEVRNIWQNRQHEQELNTATGRSRVPVLAIRNEQNATEWMAESSLIIQYLETTQCPVQA